ncbi:uncharacterized protein K452DRAFT_297275 [Aplosporella prunicola CBS 121167]|uniref:EF-hand domain-containing protein n=1 Tax=Aplosporella prunicola CBS 121167 TaxID=1176127 RepID=A0A6A6BEY1_9PEZI|nr:uncharacterized protein K452DRAFT_297275 [Aplosporella prunicola CBS 121167]KAF2142729.1 hypothetical protein K452DRAFT_297275 [Aplosporella prunicola CBS 121167]
MKLSTALVLFATLLPFAAAGPCCNSKNGNCGDGTRGTPCCGYRTCNIFCCDCGGGCRHSISLNKFTLARLQSKHASGAEEAFELAKEADTGELTLRQYTEYMGVAADDPVYVDWFYKHDTNGDGVITVDEIRLQDELEL